MADQKPRFLFDNELLDAATVIDVSSEDPGAPHQWLRDAQPTKAWRSKQFFNIRKGFNEALEWHDTDDDVGRVAFIPVGNYNGGTLAGALNTAAGSAGSPPRDLLNGCSMWLRAESLSTLDDGDSVATWNDDSGNGRNVTQSNSAARPVFRYNAVNGRPAVYFDGTGKHMQGSTLGTLLGLVGGACFIVFLVDADASLPEALWTEDDGVNSLRVGQYVRTGPVLVSQNNDGTNDEASRSTTLGAWHVGFWEYDTGVVVVAQDNPDNAGQTTTVSGNIAAGPRASTFRLGSTVGSNNLKGYIAEVITFDYLMDQGVRRRVMRYLEQKYGITNGGGAPSYTNSVSSSYAADRFTLDSSGGTGVTFLWNTGTHVKSSIGIDLGFNVAADDSLLTANTLPADFTALKSREFLRFKLLTSQAMKVFVILNHLMGSGGTITVYVGAHPDAWRGSGTVLAGDDLTRKRVALADLTGRWVVFVLEDGTAGAQHEVGVPFGGAYFEPGRSYNEGHQEQADALSRVFRADQGALHQQARNQPVRKRFTIERVSRADRDAWKAMEEHVRARHLFLMFDPLNYPGKETRYGILEGTANIAQSVGDAAGAATPDRFTINASFLENLG